jgi:hypothetical protein
LHAKAIAARTAGRRSGGEGKEAPRETKQRGKKNKKKEEGDVDGRRPARQGPARSRRVGST